MASPNALAIPSALRSYQQECLDAIKRFQASGGKRGVISLPTGTGKTVIASHLPKVAAADGKKTLFLAHREELLEQAKDQLQRYNPELWIEIEQAERHASPMVDVVVASVPTIGQMSGKRLSRFTKEEYGLVITDECHHSPANSYLRVYQHLDLFDPVEMVLKQATLEGSHLVQNLTTSRWLPDDPRNTTLARTAKQWQKALTEAFSNGGMTPETYSEAVSQRRGAAPLHIGMSATPNRTDHVGLEFVFDEIVYTRTIREMIAEGWLVDIHAYRKFTGTDISNVKTHAGEFAEGELSEAVNTPERNALCLQTWKEMCPDRRTLIFCVDVQHARDMLATFRRGGVKAEMVVGTTPGEERRETIAQYHEGEIEVMIGVGVFLEGFDDPATAAIIMARPTKSSLLLTQAIGRGTRIYPGKTDLMVIDMVDVSRGTKVATTASLFGLPPYYDCEGGSVLAAASYYTAAQEGYPGISLLDVEGEGDIREQMEHFNLFSQSMIDETVKQHSRYAWVATPTGYVLSLGAKQWVRIHQNTLGEYVLTWDIKAALQNGIPLKRMSLSEALKAGDALIVRHAPESIGLIIQESRWRQDPASTRQIGFLKALKREGKLPEYLTRSNVDLTKLSKGQASAIISIALS